MAIATLFRQISKSQNFNSTVQKFRNFSTLSSPHSLKPSINHFQGRPISNPAETLAGFHEMVSGSEQKYYMLSKIRGVGETGSVASLAVRFANHNFPTVGVSTYPAYSHSGSFDQNTCALVPIQGMHSPLLPIELEEVQVGELLVTPPGPHKETSISNECYEAAMSSFVGAVLEYTYLSQRSVTSIRCATKKIKFAKQRRGRMKGISHRGNNISFGNYALQVLEAAWITSKQLEAGRRALSRVVGRGAKIWVRVIPDKPVTARPAETRMGRGKGSVSFWVAVVQPGRILYEISGVSESIARKAVAVAASKLPVQTRFIISA